MQQPCIAIEVVFASFQRFKCVTLHLPEGTTIQSAIEQSGLLQEFPEIQLGVNSVGIFGQIASLQYKLTDGDRVEIYRPLAQDPMAARLAKLKSHRSKAKKDSMPFQASGRE